MRFARENHTRCSETNEVYLDARMIFNRIRDCHTRSDYHIPWNRSQMVNCLMESRNLFSVQSFSYDLSAVYSMDLDPTNNFLLVGMSNGNVVLQGIQDGNFGTLEEIARASSCSRHNVHRVQWNPEEEQFFSTLDNHSLNLVDPVHMRVIERFPFSIKTTWSEWNPNDRKLIAVCGTDSQTRLVDIMSGSSVQSITVSAQSGLPSHRATRCLWSTDDLYCLIVGDNEGFLHVYDTRRTSKSVCCVRSDKGQISGMSFTCDQSSIITSHGTKNSLVQWNYDNCSLQAQTNKFQKPEQPQTAQAEVLSNNRDSNGKTSGSSKGPVKKKARRMPSLSVDAYLRCQFYVSDRHVYCPAPMSAKKCKEIYIYDLESGFRLRSLKSDDVFHSGTYSIRGLLPESLVLYVGGSGRLKVWTLDEDHERKMKEKVKKYHTTKWESDDEN